MFDFHQLLKVLAYDANQPLLFNSSFFLYFLFLFFLGYTLMRNTGLIRIIFVSAFSLYFFYKACGWYVGLVLISAVVDYHISHWIDRTQKQTQRKLLLIFSLVINLGLLAYFKYTDFFIEIVNDFQQSNIKPLQLLLPVGISFYTFENISYTIDVYRKDFKPVSRFWDYLFFLSFFPKLMMGPIVRAADFIPQIRKKVQLSSENVSQGLWMILSGCFKKIVISDYLSTHLVNVVFDDPLRYSGIECLFAVYGYAMVIYCDFSGYSDMAIGIAKWMGIDVNVNFLAPYQSKSVTEFWRRWHISLSSWLRDYLYISMGGNRKGKIKTYFNLFLTMLIGGLWHGASWNFVFWGAAHGLALGFDKIWVAVFKPKIKNENQVKPSFLKHFFQVFFTFHFVCFLWIFFKAESFSIAGDLIGQIVYHINWNMMGTFISNYFYFLMMLLLAFTLHFLPLHWNDLVVTKTIHWHWSIKAIAMILILLLVSQFNQNEVIKPIYLQF